jgi:hypothetical protein
VTQILSVATKDYVIIAADRRLVRITANGIDQILEEDSCKLVNFCHSTIFSYCGLAKLDGIPTNEWLLKNLTFSGTYTMEMACNKIALLAETAVKIYDPRIRALEFLVSGWDIFIDKYNNQALQPFFCLISNRYSKTEVLKTPSDYFSIWIRKLEGKDPVMIREAGNHLKGKRVGEFCRSIKRMVVKNISPSIIQKKLIDEIVYTSEALGVKSVGQKILVAYIPKASVIRQLGGNDVMSVSSQPRSEVASFWLHDVASGKMIQHGPGFVCGNSAYTDLKMTNVEGTQSIQFRKIK